MRGPARDRPYLADATYYRVGFQLAAQLVNRALYQPSHDKPSYSVSPDDVAGYAPHTVIHEDPLSVARQVMADAQEMLSWYEQRRARARWWTPRMRPLAPQEERLRLFLTRTIVPCTLLLLDGETPDPPPPSSNDDEYARQDQDHAYTIIRRVTAGDPSYRAFYSLTCWQVSRDQGRTRDALEYLGRALHDAPRSRRPRLAEWAAEDPSLERLRADHAAEFTALVSPFRR